MPSAVYSKDFLNEWIVKIKKILIILDYYRIINIKNRLCHIKQTGKLVAPQVQ